MASFALGHISKLHSLICCQLQELGRAGLIFFSNCHTKVLRDQVAPFSYLLIFFRRRSKFAMEGVAAKEEQRVSPGL